MPAFHEAAKIAVVRLGPDTPLGFFQSLDPHSNATKLWVVDRESVKEAIILQAADERWRFDAISLVSDDVTAWSGVAMGEVEVRIDLTSGTFSDAPRYSVGSITVSGGKVYISARVSGHLSDRVTFEVGRSIATAAPGSGVFSRWQLIQRDREGTPMVLHEES